MKLKDLLTNVRKDHAHDVDVERVAREFNLDYWGWDENSKLRAYAVEQWLCTDTWVGMYAIYLDDELVGVSIQRARKSTTEYSWVGEEQAQKVKEYILSIMEEDDPVHTILTEEQLEEDWGEMYQLGYSSQLLTKEVWYNNTECPVVTEGSWGKDARFDPSFVEICYNGEDIVVPMNQVYLKFNCEGM